MIGHSLIRQFLVVRIEYISNIFLKYMAKVTGPLLSLDASGSVAKTITFSRWKGINYVRQRVIPTYSNTADQVAMRDLITDLSEAWKTGATIGGVHIDAAYKLAFDTAAQGFAYSGFNLFIRVGVSKNNGVAYDGTLELPTDPLDM